MFIVIKYIGVLLVFCIGFYCRDKEVRFIFIIFGMFGVGILELLLFCIEVKLFNCFKNL